MTLWFPQFTVPALTIDHGGLFPIRRIYCVGRNYADHAREMGADPDRELPFFFSKPADAAIQDDMVPYPPMTNVLHHEVELVVALGLGGNNMTLGEADASIFAYAVGVDLSRRDMQDDAKAQRRPWDLSKGFDASAPIGPLCLRNRVTLSGKTRLSLHVDGVCRQNGSLAAMIWSPAEIIARLSTFVTLKPGDLIFTGTPAGVGTLPPDCHVQAEVSGLPPLAFTVGAAP